MAVDRADPARTRGRALAGHAAPLPLGDAHGHARALPVRRRHRPRRLPLRGDRRREAIHGRPGSASRRRAHLLGGRERRRRRAEGDERQLPHSSARRSSRRYERLGVEADSDAAPTWSRARPGPAICTPRTRTCRSGSRKLSGSAQVWHRDTVLQHGSFVFSRDSGVKRASSVSQPMKPSALSATTATISDLIAQVPSSETSRRPFVRRSSDCSASDLAFGDLTPEEESSGAGARGQPR